MVCVTGLRERSRGRVAVELDGARWRTIPGDVVLHVGLTVGERLTRERLRDLRRELRRSEALEQATQALRYRDLSSQHLRRRLEQRRTAPAAREEALATLEAVGVVDDARVARTRAESLAGRGMGDAAIRFDLSRQAVAADLVEEALAMIEPESERARRLVAAHGRGARTARLLARRGFGEDAIEAAVGPLD